MPRFSLVSGRRRRGYTLVEAMVALSLTAMAGAVVLLSVETSLSAADQAWEQTVAAGLAEQLADEVLGAMYCAPGGDPHQSALGPSTWEAQGAGRERFDEIGDYHGWVANPPQDPWGAVVGQGGDDPDAPRHPNFAAPEGAFDAWRQQVEVYYVDPSDPSSNFRAVEVVIGRQLASGDWLELARARRVVPLLPTVP